MKRGNSAHPSNLSHDIFKDVAKKKKVKDTKKDAPPAVHVGEHGRYLIKSGRLAGNFVARAFPKPPTTARGLIAEAKGETEEAAIAALHKVIDERETGRAEARREDPQSGEAVPSVEEYIEAIGQVALTAPQRAMLTALSLADAEGLTEARMGNVGGYKSLSAATRAFASVGQSIAAYLASGAIATGTASISDGVSILGFRGEPQDDEDPGNWILHPELREAALSAL